MVAGYRKPRMWRGFSSIPYVVGEGRYFLRAPVERRNTAWKNARKSKSNPTAAEKRMEEILHNLNAGVLRGRFLREWTLDDKWNLDFFFYENRLAIEVDGSIHNRAEQKKRDRQKEKMCLAWDITLIRITNREVFGDEELLINKLRAGWRKANARTRGSPFEFKLPRRRRSVSARRAARLSNY